RLGPPFEEVADGRVPGVGEAVGDGDRDAGAVLDEGAQARSRERVPAGPEEVVVLGGLGAEDLDPGLAEGLAEVRLGPRRRRGGAAELVEPDVGGEGAAVEGVSGQG